MQKLFKGGENSRKKPNLLHQTEVWVEADFGHE